MTQENNFKSFDDMDFLNFDLMRGIFDYGFQNPSRIQNLTIKNINDGYDIIAQSQSGTGKTGAFTIGALSIINPEDNSPQVIILANTHELATQIHFVVTNLSKHMNIKVALCIGGTSIVNQHSQGNSNRVRDPYLHIRQSHVLIGTPGRIFDYIERRAFNPTNIKMFVMDEADALLKNDFIEQIKQIFKKLNEVCQIIIFSATYPDEIIEIADSITSEPKKKILMKHEELSLDLIKQYKVDVRYESIKYSTLADLYTKLQIGQCIIFVNNIATANNIEKRLLENGFGVGKIHGGLSSDIRSQVLKDFRIGITRVLISTDVLSRGIDIEQIGIVINYDLPSDHAQYIHRIGRSGRFGKIGVAINFITNSDRNNLRNIESHYKSKIDDMPDPSIINNFLSGTDGHLKLNKN